MNAICRATSESSERIHSPFLPSGDEATKASAWPSGDTAMNADEGVKIALSGAATTNRIGVARGDSRGNRVKTTRIAMAATGMATSPIVQARRAAEGRARTGGDMP